MQLLKYLLLFVVMTTVIKVDAAIGYDRALRVAKGDVNIADTVGGEKAFRRVAFTVGTTNPNLNVNVSPMDYEKAFKDLKTGKIQLVITDRPPSAAKLKQDGIYCKRYACDPVLFIVKHNNPVDNISMANLKKIFDEDIITWKPFTKQGYMIHLAGVQSGCPGFKALTTKVIGNNKIKAKYFKLTKASELIILTTASEHMLSFCGYISPRDDIKFLQVDGITPTAKNIISGKYKPNISYYICLNKKSGKTAFALAGLLTTHRVKNLLIQMGYLPVSVLRK
ncbi:MAG: hypothetical protein GY750_14910 [Lentisphaerae bacterium]|nr:hypothetical protein [Lentisphaerota bacterium]MCP4102691.1 hypothetical protein [Lentisphaerota bacterium]